ncbi:MAG: hypothetical protein HOK72_13150 [Flavobacteriales bacterium]|jgi:hypothetical protein|nr:hypothetical protein [Flavobacteriales bacterium]
MKKLLLFLLLIPNLVMAETTSVWGDDGSLTIIQSETKPEVKYTVGEDSQTEISVSPQDGETIFIYGDELTIIQDTDMGIIQY